MPVVLNGNQFGNGSSVGSLITVTRKPTKTEYIEGENLNLQGMQVTFYNANKDPIVVEDYTTIPAKNSTLSRSDSNVIIQYKSRENEYFSTVLPINIKYPVNIEVIDQDIDIIAGKLNINNLKVNIVYNDNTRKLLTSYTTVPANGDSIGENKSVEILSGNFKTYVQVVSKAATNKSLTYAKDLITFGTGTWEEIDRMLKSANLGNFKMSDFWKVGDERKIGSTTFVVLDFVKHMDEYDDANVLIGNKDLINSHTQHIGYCDVSGNRSNYLNMKYAEVGTRYDFKRNTLIYETENFPDVKTVLGVKKFLDDAGVVNVMKNPKSEQSRYFSASNSDTNLTADRRTYINYKELFSRLNFAVRAYTASDIVGEMALKYYQIASNRIKYDASKTPKKYCTKDIFIELDESKFSKDNYKTLFLYTKMDGGRCKFFEDPRNFMTVKYTYIDELGNVQQANAFDTSKPVAYDFGFAIFFAI